MRGSHIHKRKTLEGTSAATEKAKKLRAVCTELLNRLKAKTYVSKRQLTIEWFSIKKTKADIVDAFNSWVAVIVFSDQIKLQATQNASILRVMSDNGREGAIVFKKSQANPVSTTWPP
jgi:hypothetical protein